MLPHLHDRPLTLKRYPNGVEEPYFYEKQSPSHRPEWIQTVKIGDINYTLAQDRPTLIWLANLADVELHTSLSLAARVDRPTMMVFDLDPGAPAGIVERREVALVLRGLFDALEKPNGRIAFITRYALKLGYSAVLEPLALTTTVRVPAQKAGVPGLEPRTTEPESAVLPITPYPTGVAGQPVSRAAPRG